MIVNIRDSHMRHSTPADVDNTGALHVDLRLHTSMQHRGTKGSRAASA